MATPAPALMGFTDYQTALANVNAAIVAGTWGTAFVQLAKAQVILAGLPNEVITGQQTTRFRALKELEGLRASITQAQIASQTGGAGMGIGMFKPVRAR